MDIAYYPGCALHGTAKEYDESLRALCTHLGIGLQELDDWNCCGASAAHMTNAELNVALNARNLALAEKQESPDLLAPCPLCSGIMMKVQKLLADDAEKLAEVKDTIAMPDYRNDTNILNVIQVLAGALDKLKEKMVNPLKGAKAACYYGCFLVRPPKVVNFDDPENPQEMDKFVAALGCEPVDWVFKTECCGAGFTMSNPDAVTRLVAKILEDAKDSGAEFVVVACPMCHANLDLKQAAVAKMLDWGDFRLPVIYITQLAGLAVGIDPKVLGLHRHLVPTDSFVKKYAATGASNG